MTRLTALVFGCVVVLSACGSDSPTSVSDGEETDGDGSAESQSIDFEIVAYGGPIDVSCGSVVFPDRNIDLGIYPVFIDHLGDFVPDNFREEFDLEWEEGLKDVVLREIEHTGTRIHLFGMVPGAADGRAHYREIAFDLRGDEWRMDIWGGCRPEVKVNGFGIGELRLDATNQPTASTETLTLLVTERACASGELPVGRAIAPVVFESENAVDVLMLIEDSRGHAECPDNPSFPLTVELEAPLGDRVVRDVSVEPPVELAWPIPTRPSELSIVIEGAPPDDGTANVFAWTGTQAGAFLLESQGWSEFAGWIQAWSPADEPRVISGFVAACGADGCAEECEGEACVAADRLLGPECSAGYEPMEGFDSTITISYANQTCTIDQQLTPIP